MNSNIPVRERSAALVLCAASAVGVLTLCTTSSFLYPLNIWVDSNCFFTVGKGMLHGLVPYRDLLEQKGPLLYMLHALAALISEDSFFGVYLLELLAAFGFLYFSYKTLRLFTGPRALFAVPVLALAVYTSYAFVHGSSAEEFCLPILMWDLYLALRAAREERVFSRREWIAVGVRAGCVFWIKFTLVGLYVGLFLYQVWLLRKTRAKEILFAAGAVAVGVLISTLPHLIYFGLHGAIGDWLEVYLYNNLFLYSGGDGRGIVWRLARGVYSIYLSFRLCGILCAVGALWLLWKDRKTACALILGAASAYIFVFFGGYPRPYYPFVFAIFAPLGFLPLSALADKWLSPDLPRRKTSAVVWVMTAACMALAAWLTPNRYLRAVEKEDLPQYQFKAIVQQEENPTLLNYGFLDGGFYTVCDVLPTCRAFCQLNIVLDEMYQDQQDCVARGDVEFVVTRNSRPEWPLYEPVAEASDGANTYCLYQRKE